MGEFKLMINVFLAQKLDEFFQAGYTPLISQFKVANLCKWKDVDRNYLYNVGVSFLKQGVGNSLTLRLDKDLIALDLDFKNEELTKAFLDSWGINIGSAYTVQGAKGCKIFARLKGKTSPCNTLKLKTVYSSKYDFLLLQNKNIKNELEIKQDLSCVAGFHSERLLYGFYPNTLPICSVPSFDKLPLIEDINDISIIYDDAINACGFISEQIKLKPLEFERGVYMLRLAQTSPQKDIKLIIDFLEYFKYEFAQDCLQVVYFNKQNSKYKVFVDRAKLNADGFISTCDRRDLTYRLFAKEHEHLANEASLKGLMRFEVALSTNMFKLFEILQNVK